MNEETIRTRAINYTRTNWKTVVAYGVAVVSSIITASVKWGTVTEHTSNMEANYQSDKAAFARRLDSIDSKLDALASVPAQMRNFDERQTRMEDNWDNAFQHAGDTPRPSHRARKP